MLRGTHVCPTQSSLLQSIMSDIIRAIYAVKDPDAPRVIGAMPKLILVAGMTAGEQAFVLQNQAKLGSGAARRFASTTMGVWAAFTALSMVTRLLVGVLVTAVIVAVPFMCQAIWLASKDPINGLSLVASIVVGIVLVMTLTTASAYL